jgi:gliding motility-associated-like protein
MGVFFIAILLKTNLLHTLFSATLLFLSRIIIFTSYQSHIMQLRRLLLAFVVLFAFGNNASLSQTVCLDNGQNPSSAFPVCGSSAFVQSNVNLCGNFPVPVKPCLGDGYTYTDINPYWYKFTCFKTGTLSLYVNPNDTTDDYDWQLFDITGHNPSDVYTDSSLIVCCNWSGNPGRTGADSTGTAIFNCGGYGYPNISAMPTIIIGHQYLLLVSHFTNTQSGYSLSFGTGGGTAVITDTLPPNLSTVALKCSGSAIGIRLNKPMLCNTLATNGGDFTITTNPTIDSVVGHGCKYGFDMDSLTIYLAAPLDTGRYILITKLDSLGGEITDICGKEIPVGDSFYLYRTIALPTKLDSITTPLPCAPQQLQLVFDRPMLCDSVAPDGSQFAITGPSSVTIASATTNCDTNGLTSIIYVNLANPITVGGTYKITLKDGVNLTSLYNECSVATPPGESVTFYVEDKVSAAFNTNISYGCKNDTLITVFNGSGNPTDTSTTWRWYLGDSLVSTADTGFRILTFNPQLVQLFIANSACSDSSSQTFVPVDHSISVGFTIAADTICSNSQASFTDTSTGSIVSWQWNFGGGNTSTLQDPPPQTYPTIDSTATYQASLVAINVVGCHDTASHPITVLSAKPAVVDSVRIDTCGTQSIHFFFNKPIQCSSVDSNGANFTLVKLVGPKQDTIPIVNAEVISCANNLGEEVEVNLGFEVGDQLELFIHSDSIGNRILNECNVAVADTSFLFSTSYTIAADFYDSILVGCKTDTLYAFDSCKAATKWQWVFDSTQTSTSPTPVFVFTGTNPKMLYLKASNTYCSASDTFTIVPLPHSLTTAFSFQDTACPLLAAFSNQTVGKVIGWQWNFGNGDTSKELTPPAINYPLLDTFKTYPVSLIARDSFGCIDTSNKTITIKPGAPALIDTIVPLPCSPKFVELTFNNSYLCSSLSADGSNFLIAGPSNVVIDSAAGVCKAGLSDTVKLFLASPIVVSGIYNVKIQKASNGTELVNGCNIPSPLGDALNFKALDAVDATFDPIVQYGCKVDTITFFHNSLNGIDQWNWTFISSNDTTYSTQQDTTIFYTDFSPKKVELTVSNNICSDTKDTTITLLNDTDIISPAFVIEKQDDGTIQATDFLCPNEAAIFKDASTGIIHSWYWNFGNGQTSTQQDPPTQAYLIGDSIVNYLVSLTITGDYCTDTTYRYLKVIPNCYIAVPSAFTPSATFNNYLYPLNAWKAGNLVFRVFDRWGQLVFETSDWTIKWDGRIHGSQPIVGTYVWTLDYTDHDTQQPIHEKGTTVLIR